MRHTNWQDLATRVAPLVVSVVTAYYSYRLNKAKSDRENAKDQFDRLTDEVEKIRRDRDNYYEEIKRLNKENLKLRKELLLHDSEKQQREAEHDK